MSSLDRLCMGGCAFSAVESSNLRQASQEAVSYKRVSLVLNTLSRRPREEPQSPVRLMVFVRESRMSN